MVFVSLRSVVRARVRLVRGIGLALGAILVLGQPTSLPAAEPPLNIDQMLKQAKAGECVTLPEGTFRTSVALPEGASLRGAGYEKTILEAGSPETAIAVKGGQKSRIEDLTIRTQGNTGIAVEGAAQVTVSRVIVRGGAVGVRLEKVTDARVENTIVEGSMTGVLLNKVQNTAVVNCTLVGNSSIGLSVLDAEKTAIFNNLVVDASTGIVVGGKRDGLAVDCNLYLAHYVGKLLGHPNRVMLGPWRDVSGGLDANSVQVPVELADVRKGNFRPVSRLDWAPDCATTSDWGVPELAGFRAPAKDIDGCERLGAVDVGAYEVPRLEGIKHDATFVVSSDAGTKSAGLFTPDGRLVRYLFQNLPLKKGEYGCVLPTRTQLGDAVAAGQCQVRVVESNLRWRYRGITANNGLAGSMATTDQHHTQWACFAPDGALLLGAGWNERGENLRSRDLQTGKANWQFPGQSEMNGLCVGEDKNIYCLRPESDKGQYVLARLDPSTGRPLPWPDGRPQISFSTKEAKLHGMVELGGSIYVTDTAHDRVCYAPLNAPAFDKLFDIKAPSSPAADRMHKLLWLVSNREKLIALDSSGKVRAEFAGVPKPIGLAVRGNRMAVASAATGMIHLLDCTDPAALRSVRTIGRGDGPYGPILPDRFYFQEHRYNSVPWNVSLDLDDEGRLAVRDYFSRTIVFDAQGKAIYHSFAQFGNFPRQAFFEGDTQARFFDSGGDVSWLIDAQAGTWKPDAHWAYPRGKRADAVGFFSDAGKQFGVFQYQGRQNLSGILIVQYENCVGRPVALYTNEEVADPADPMKKRRMWVVNRDTDGDGWIDEKDAPGTPVVDTDGKAIQWHMPARFIFALPDGSLVSPIGTSNPNGLGFVWKRKGLDAQGAPRYEFGPDSLIPVKERIVPSMYDFSKTEDLASQSETAFAPGGDYLATFQFRSGPNGMSLSNSGGLDIGRFDRSGEIKWLRPMNDFGPVQGIKPSARFTLTSWGHQAEWIGLDDNGLDLGHLGYPAEAGWFGYWVDHPTQYITFRGNDGRLHVLAGDYMLNCQHWLTLENYDNYRSASFPVSISPAKAHELTFRPAVAYRVRAKPAQPRITIRKLREPLAIDGKLEKWRRAGITPQIVMTPVTGTDIRSPKDASAVVRLAYLGQDLYVQILRFDDVVTFHQPSTKTHVQDTMEMMLNGFWEGFQFSVSRFTDIGPGIVRRRFFYGKLEDRTPAEHAPRVVEVLDNAKEVTERRLIESIYGEDMADCKVIVTEFKLPIDKITYKGSEESLFPVKSGSGVWIGFMIDDNDVPGSDAYKNIVWPATYNTFSDKENGAYAVFE